MADRYVKRSTSAGLAIVEFYSPQGNALPGDLLSTLALELEAAQRDEAAAVILLRSGGEGAFCGGASFQELKGVKTAEQGTVFFSGFAKVILAMTQGAKPVVVRAHGKAAGGGVGLIAASDYALASEAAHIRLSELSIGIGPFTIGPAVERRVGHAAFAELAYSADWRSAAWAAEHGLYQSVSPSVVELDVAVEVLCKRLCGYSAQALKQLKRTVWSGTESWSTLLVDRARISAELLLSAEAQSNLSKM